jgi:chromatin remodeling complex protein RSC6
MGINKMSQQVSKSKARKSTGKVSTRAPVPDVADVIPPAPVKRVRKKPAPIEEIKEEEVVVTTTTTTTADLLSSDVPIEDRFANLVSCLQLELDATRANKKRQVATSTWRKLITDVKQLKVKVMKAAKKPKRKVTNGNSKSGLLKPVKVSQEMAEFAGWDPSELKSRVDAYRSICQYVKSNNLQNPNDRRQIIADDTLKSLLKYDENVDPNLTYCYLQTKLKPHFV